MPAQYELRRVFGQQGIRWDEREDVVGTLAEARAAASALARRNQPVQIFDEQDQLVTTVRAEQ